MANTISVELNRLIQAKTNIRTALQEKCGLTIGDSSTLDEFPGLIQEMEVGGGGSDTSTLIDLIEGDVSTLVIPEGATKIGQSALSNKSLVGVSIPNTVTSIEAFAFKGCKQLKNIIIPNSVVSLQDGVFQETGLNSIILSNSISSIPFNTFQKCSSLKNIIIPDSVTSIGNMAFNEAGLNNIIIPNTVTSIGNYAFMRADQISMVFLRLQPPTIGSGCFSFSGSKPFYVKNSAVDTYKNAGGNWNDVSTRITPLAAINYDASTYTVTASGRDNVELYVDASLINSSVYTFVPDTIDVSHNITVKSVDPSLGILDTVSQEILIEGETQELKNYFALTAVQNSSVGFEINNNVDLKYSSDGVNWSNMTSGNAGKLNLPAGETLYFKGNNPSTPQGLGYFQLTGQVDASGNAMSLIYDDNFENQLTAPNYAFQSLFLSCTALNSVEDLLLPATTLGEGCYRSLFYGCTNITKAPVLPATTLVRYCYASMFSGCSSLNYIKAMFTSEPSDSALSGWTSNVANTGTFVMNAAAEWNPEEYDLEIGDLVWDWTIEKVNA